MMTANLAQAIQSASVRLARASSSPRLDAQLIAAHVLQTTREWIIAHDDAPLTTIQHEAILRSITRREAGEPMAHLLGTRDFWNKCFKITADTLIPRPETELLVETLLDRFDQSPLCLADMGTGSGVIAISIAEERPGWNVTATDISAAALAVARENGASCSNLNFRQGDWCEALTGSYDIIVSNPPYIRANDPHLADLNFEPSLALVAGEDGMAAYDQLIPQAFERLRPGGTILLEHGYDQQTAVTVRLAESGFKDIETLRDLIGHPRATLAKRNQMGEA